MVKYICNQDNRIRGTLMKFSRLYICQDFPSFEIMGSMFFGLLIPVIFSISIIFSFPVTISLFFLFTAVKLNIHKKISGDSIITNT